MMMHTKNVYNGVLHGTLEIENRFDKNFPVYPKIDKIADHIATRLSFAALYILFYINFATSWWMYLLLPIHFLIGPIQGAIVNWADISTGIVIFQAKRPIKKYFVYRLLNVG